MPNLQEITVDQPDLGLQLDRPTHMIDDRGCQGADDIRFVKGAAEPRNGYSEFYGDIVFDGIVLGFGNFLDTDAVATPVIGTETDLLAWLGTGYSTGTLTAVDSSATLTVAGGSWAPTTGRGIMPEDVIRWKVSGVFTEWQRIAYVSSDLTLELVTAVATADAAAGVVYEIKRTFRYLTDLFQAGTAWYAGAPAPLDQFQFGGSPDLSSLAAGDMIMVLGADDAGSFHRKWDEIQSVDNTLKTVTLTEDYGGGLITVAPAAYVVRRVFGTGQDNRWVFDTVIHTAGNFLVAVNNVDVPQKWAGTIPSYTDAITVSEGTAVVGGTPGIHKYVLYTGVYLAFANGGDTTKTRQNWKHSSALDPEDFAGGVASEYIFAEGGDAITGFRKIGNLIEVHKKSGISFYSEVGGDPPFRRGPYRRDVGNSLPYALTGTADQSFFVAGDDFYVSSGDGTVRPYKDADNSLWRKFMDTSGTGAKNKAFSYYQKKMHMLYIFYATDSGQTVPDKVLVVSEKGGVSFYDMECSGVMEWLVANILAWSDMPSGQSWDDTEGSWASQGGTLDAPREIQGKSDAKLYFFQEGFSDDGVAYTSSFATKVFRFPYKVIIRRVRVVFDAASGTAELDVVVYRKYEDSDDWSAGDSGTIAIAGTSKFTFYTRVSGKMFYVTFGSNDANADWKVKRFEVAYVPVAERFDKEVA